MANRAVWTASQLTQRSHAPYVAAERKRQMSAMCCRILPLAAITEIPVTVAAHLQTPCRRRVQLVCSQLRRRRRCRRRSACPGSARHISAQTPDQGKSRCRFLWRELFQQPLLSAPHPDTEGVEQGASFGSEVNLDTAGVIAAYDAAHVLFLFHAHQRTAERRLLHHRAIDDLLDRDAVAHGEHG